MKVRARRIAVRVPSRSGSTEQRRGGGAWEAQLRTILSHCYERCVVCLQTQWSGAHRSEPWVGAGEGRWQAGAVGHVSDSQDRKKSRGIHRVIPTFQHPSPAKQVVSVEDLVRLTKKWIGRGHLSPSFRHFCGGWSLALGDGQISPLQRRDQ